MSGKTDIHEKRLEEQYLSLEKTFEKLIKEYQDKGTDPTLQYAFNMALKSFRAELDAFMKVCQTLAPGLELKFSPVHLMSASFGQEGIDSNQAVMQDVALSETTKTELVIDQKAKKLAELLFTSLDPASKGLDNPLAFIGKMKVFFKSTAVSGNVNDVLKANVRNTLEKAVILFGVKLNEEIRKMQVANASARDINAFRTSAINICQDLSTNKDLGLSATAAITAQKLLVSLEAAVQAETKHPSPKPPGIINSA